MLGTIVLVAALGAAATAAQEGSEGLATVSVTYDKFMVKSPQERIRVFNQVTPENRAELVRTHLKRWMDRNAARLTPEQTTVLKENLAFITAERYRDPKKPEDQAEAKALVERTAQVFTREDMLQALTIRGDYILPVATK